MVRTTMVLAAALLAFGVCLLADRPAVSQAKGTVYLTFDDGPVRPGTPIAIRGSDNAPLDGDTPAVLAALQKHRVKATFFFVGEQIRRHSHLVRRAHLQGHSVQNHTDTHPHLTQLTDEEIRRELKRANRAVVQAGAPKPRLFRPPYGDTNQRVKRVGASVGLPQRLWNVAPGDSANPPAHVICKRVVSRAKPRAKPRAVILLHDGTGANTAKALPCIIKKLRAKGYRFGKFQG